MPRTRHARTLRLLATAAALVAGCTGAPTDGADAVALEDLAPQGLHWVAPLADDTVDVGDPLELAVATQNPAALVVHFAVDGQEVGACDASQPDDDCHDDAASRWTVSFDAPGPHALRAWFTGPDGAPVEATRAITVQPAAAGGDDGTADPESSDAEPDPVADPDLATGAVDSVAQPISAARGYLDPDRPFHAVFGGLEWAVQGQRVVFRSGQLQADPDAAARCMARYGDSITRYADLRYVSRASVVAALAVRDDCDGAGFEHPLVAAGTCAHYEPSLSRAACRARMRSSPDFAIDIATRYLASRSSVRRHQHDAPRIAAVLFAGGVRRTGANRWHMLPNGSQIDGFVGAYNAYRTWEHAQSTGGGGGGGSGGRATPPADWPHRPVFARMYQQGMANGVQSGLRPSESIATFAQALADFRPTYVSGLIRINDPTDHAGNWLVPSAQMVADWNTVRAAVRARNPNALFDVVLSAKDANYASGGEMVEHMQQIVAAGVNPEVWFFDFYTDGTPDAHGVYPVAHAIAWAHEHGYLIGGHLFSSPDHLHGTEHSDFYALVDHAELEDADVLRSRGVSGNTWADVMDRFDSVHAALDVPLLGQINNNPQNDSASARTGSCIFNEVYDQAQRYGYVHRYAANQAAHHYHYMYNLFFPDCRHGDADVYYDSQTDCQGAGPTAWQTAAVGACASHSMWDAMKQLADSFNAL